MKKLIIIAFTAVTMAGSVYAYKHINNDTCCCGVECTCTNCKCTTDQCNCDANCCDAPCCIEAESCCSQ